MHDRRLPRARRIDPETGEVWRAPARGRMERREPSSKPINHMRFDWFPIAVWSGREKLARLMLEDAGLTTFCPVEVRWRNANKYDRARRAKRQIGYPVVPGLIFTGFKRIDEPGGCQRCSGSGVIQVATAQETEGEKTLVYGSGPCPVCGGSGAGRRLPNPWHLVMASHVVSHVVSVDPRRPRRLNPEAIGRLLEAKDRGRFVRPEHQRHMETGKEFGEGDAVRMIRGPFEGKGLRVEKIDGAMLGAFVMFFGERRLIWLPLEDAVMDEE